MELWDSYDNRGNRISGETLVRGEPVPEGRFHLVCEVLVRHRDGTYLLMRRDPRKHFGGFWEATAGGSALRGEAALDCALRELREETGIRAETLTELGTVIHCAHRTIYVDFLCETDWDKNAVTLQDGETVAFRWVTGEEFRILDKTNLVTTRMQVFVPELRK